MKNITLLLILLFIGCAQEVQKTPLKVSIGAVTGSTLFPAGLIITGKSNNGFKISKKVPAGEEVDLILPNGTWSFSIIGWDDPSFLMQGNTYCDHKANISLSGQDIFLNFNASSSKCINDVRFGGNLNSAQDNFEPLKIVSCSQIRPYLVMQAGGTNVIPQGLNCQGGSNEPLPGEFKSFKVILPELIAGGQQLLVSNGALVSDCVNAGSLNYITSSLNIPRGSESVFLPTIIRGFSGPSCTGYTKDTTFTKGLYATAFDIQGASAYFQGSEFSAFVNSATCTDEQIQQQIANSDPFPLSIAGTPSSYLICREDDLQYIADSTNGDTDGVYHLGQDIDLGGSNTSINQDFNGIFKGNFKKISNGNQPLFASIKLNTSMEVEISNLTLESFNITGNDNFGVLTNYLGHPTSANYKGAEVWGIKVVDGSITSTMSGAGIGGLIGVIDLSNNTSASNDDQVFIRRNSVNGISITSNMQDQYLGGLVGKSIGASAAVKVAYEINKVGMPADDDITDTSEQVYLYSTGYLQGSGAVGGMLGTSEFTEIRDFNYVIAEVEANENVGGLIGFASTDTKIENSFSLLTYLPDTGSNCSASSVTNTCNNIGGIIGKVNDSNNVKIEGTVNKLIIDSHTRQLDNVGGIVGRNDSGGVSNLEIKDVSTTLNIESGGNYYGGLIGYFAPTSDNGGISETITSSIVRGYIKFGSGATTDEYRAGLAGYASHLRTYLSSVDIEIEGSLGLAGGYAYSTGQSKIIETHLKSKLISDLNVASDYKIGGAIGYLANYPGTIPLDLLKIESDIELLNKDMSSPTYYESIGVVFGQANLSTTSEIFANTILANSIALGSIVDTNSSEVAGIYSNFLCGEDDTIGTVGSCNTSNGFTTDVYTTENTTACSNLSGNPFVMDTVQSNTCVPLFYKKWLEVGLETVDGTDYLRAGSKLEPILLKTPQDWDAIGNDMFMVRKTYALGNNIDFNGATTNLIGDGTNPFQGQMLSNGYRIEDTSGQGLFGKIQNGKIGDRRKPFNIDSLNLECATTNCGIVNEADGAELYINATNINLQDGGNTLQCLGGFVGGVATSSNLSIEHSKFHGTINAPNSNQVGALIGCLADGSTPSVSIEDVGVDLFALIADDFVGGLIGHTDTSQTIEVTNAYVHFIPNTTYSPQINSIGGPYIAGLIGNLESAITTSNVLIDIREATYSGNFDACIKSTTTPGVTSTNAVLLESTAGTAACSYLSIDVNTSDVNAAINQLAPGGEDFVLQGEKIKLEFEANGFENY